MAETTHLDLAEQHLETLLFLQPSLPSNSRWVTILAMYTALPVVDHVLELKHGECPGSHKARGTALNAAEYRKTKGPYRILERRSWEARYGRHSPSVPSEKVTEFIIKGALIPTLAACKSLAPQDRARIESMILKIKDVVDSLSVDA